MPGERPSFLNQIFEMWSRLQWSQRISILLFGFLTLALIGSVVYFMNRVEYEVLYRDLNPEDAQAIATKLEEDKIDYIVQGTSILVAAHQNEIDKLRLEIAGAGLGRSGRIGYEIFDKSQFGMTDFTEQVNLQRALEGELARTISSLSEIYQARVHIVLPKDSIFEEDKEEAKACVVVKLREGSEISKGVISGIKGVVSGAVPGLRTYNVSVVDDEGKLLSQSLESGDTASTEVESGIREQLEKGLASKVISILEPLVGKGKVHANASIELDFNSSEQMEETFNPNPPIILSQQRTEERTGGLSATSGIPGTQSNVTPEEAPSVETTPERIRQSEVTNYEVNKLVRHTVQPKGTIRRLSVAVILDHRTLYTKEPDGKVVAAAQARSKEEIAAYRELVNAAVGYNEERGDVVTIENVPFYSESRPIEDQPAIPWYIQWRGYLLPAIKYTAFLLLFLLVYFVLFRPIRKRVFQNISLAALGPGQDVMAQLPAEAPPQALSEARQSEKLAAPAAEEKSARPPLQTAETPKELFDTDVSEEQIERELLKEANLRELGSSKYMVLKKKLTEKAKKEPEMFSQLIRSWLREKG